MVRMQAAYQSMADRFKEGGLNVEEVDGNAQVRGEVLMVCGGRGCLAGMEGPGALNPTPSL